MTGLYKFDAVSVLTNARQRIERGWLNGGGLIAGREGENTNQSYDNACYCLVAGLYAGLNVPIQPDCVIRNRNRRESVNKYQRKDGTVKSVTYEVDTAEVSIIPIRSTGWNNERIIRSFLNNRVNAKLLVSLLFLLTEVTGADDLEAWNDADGRTQQDVLDALDQAIEIARSRAA